MGGRLGGLLTDAGIIIENVKLAGCSFGNLFLEGSDALWDGDVKGEYFNTLFSEIGQ